MRRFQSRGLVGQDVTGGLRLAQEDKGERQDGTGHGPSGPLASPEPPGRAAGRGKQRAGSGEVTSGTSRCDCCCDRPQGLWQQV